MQRAQVAVEKWANKFIDRYDTSGTGKLDEEQRAQLVKGISEEVEKRVKKFDTEGKGRPTPAQTLDMLEDFAKWVRKETLSVSLGNPGEPPAPSDGGAYREDLKVNGLPVHVTVQRVTEQA